MSNETVEGAQATDQVVEAKEVELSPIEQTASEQGWVPKEQWEEAGNDPKDWRDAREFVDRGELFKTIHNTRRELKQAQGAVSALQKHQEYIFEKGYQKALADLKMERRQAVRNEDFERVEEIEDQIDEVKEKHDAEKQAMQQSVAQAQAVATPHPDFERWSQKNQWYFNEPEMQEFADVTGIMYAKRNPGADPMYVLKHIEDKVRKQFPDKFGARRAAPSPTASVDRTARVTRSGKDDVELDDNERIIMADLVRNKVMTEAEYKAEIKKVRGK